MPAAIWYKQGMVTNCNGLELLMQCGGVLGNALSVRKAYLAAQNLWR